MNIYLDIDGVLRGVASPQEDVEAFLKYCLDNFSGSIYWLTSFCKGGVNNAIRMLQGAVSDELLEELQRVEAAEWYALKTDGIDFKEPFVWFDDNLFEADKAVLEKHDAMASLFQMNPYDPEMAKKALEHLKTK